ncbi:MAG: DUF445 family protein [Desulfovibrionaceae bacterium]|jgi:uncharacterized membrane protein YheB (UPF0754 family)|nr:DUF445 family protein [Desulfovibrionaceae bacterium]
MDLETLKYLVSPVVCALIGWFTNYLAVKMLFHPRAPIRFGPLVLQGIFPKRQKALAANLGRMIENELVSHEDLNGVLADPAFVERLSKIADPYIDAFISDKLRTLHPMVGMFLNEEMSAKIKGLLSAQVARVAPAVVHSVAQGLEERLDFSELVREKIESFSMDKLEEILFSIMRSEFRFVELMGGVLGLLIGILQSVVLYLL